MNSQCFNLLWIFLESRTNTKNCYEYNQKAVCKDFKGKIEMAETYIT